MSLKEKILKKIYKVTHLRPRKMHLDYVAGLLSIPVLITAIVINWGNLNKDTAQPIATTPTPYIIVVPDKDPTPSNTVTTQVCKKNIGPVEIVYPKEGEVVADNPVCIEISYSDSTYCSVVWSYRINNGSWSEYNNNSPCIYNMPNGNVKFELRVNSTVSQETKTIMRNFMYNGANNPTATPTNPTATPSAQ